MKFKFYITLAVVMLLQAFAFANNISVKKVSLTDTNTVAKTVMIKLDLSWENSWRDDINWDAAWVFVKFKKKNGTWAHVTLSASGHLIGTSSNPAKINVPADQKGAFMYRTGNGAGTINITDIKLLWNYGADGVTDLDSLETRVFATEVVYVPEGSFAAGDGSAAAMTGILCNANYISDYVLIQDTLSVPLFRQLPNPNPPGTPLLKTKTIWVDGRTGIDTTGDGTIDLPDFPTGYKAFYCMKYEVSQGQYADMLNTLSFDPANLGTGTNANKPSLFFPIFPTSTTSRFTISLQDSVYFTPRPDRGCNQLTGFGLSFADWAGLRPMSEFEFEKACRGPLAPLPYERAFISSYGMPPGNFRVKGEENGTETFVNNWGVASIPGELVLDGDGGTGPHRVGIFATDTTSRNSSGASFYGIMDLTDNLAEYVVYYDTELKFKGINGDGLLPGVSPASFHNVAGWPIINNPGTTAPGAYTLPRAKTAGVSSMLSGVPQAQVGFRGVRYAPAGN